MALDIEKLKTRLAKVKGELPTSSEGGASNFWKPEEGKEAIIRIVTKDDDPYHDYSVHYNVGEEPGFLCPKRNYGDQCPVCDFATSLWHNGDDDDKAQAKKLFPTQRFYTYVLVRGEESKGVRIWGFGRRVYETLLNLMLNPDYGDVTDVKEGRDLIITYKKNKGDFFPTTTIMPRPKITDFCGDLSEEECGKMLEAAPKFDKIFIRRSTKEVKEIANKNLLKEGDGGKEEVEKFGKEKEEDKVVNSSDSSFDEAFDEMLGSK